MVNLNGKKETLIVMKALRMIKITIIKIKNFMIINQTTYLTKNNNFEIKFISKITFY
jgi:hypothetical protein